MKLSGLIRYPMPVATIGVSQNNSPLGPSWNVQRFQNETKELAASEAEANDRVSAMKRNPSDSATY